MPDDPGVQPHRRTAATAGLSHSIGRGATLPDRHRCMAATAHPVEVVLEVGSLQPDGTQGSSSPTWRGDR
jgi:hypothetical protein